MSAKRPVILHVVEPLAAGILKSISGLCWTMEDRADLYVLHGGRELLDDYQSYFPDSVTFVKWSVGRKISLQHDLSAVRQLQKTVRKLNPEIIHAHSSKAGALCRIAIPSGKRNIIYSPRGYSFVRRDLSRKGRLVYSIFEWLLGRTKHLTVACGRAEYVSALKVARRAILIPNMVSGFSQESLEEEGNPSVETLVSGSDHVPTIVMSGRIYPQKNFPFFCQVAREMSDVACKFVWIGDGTIPDGVNIPPNVTLTGWLAMDEAVERVKQSDIFFQCSLWEGLPNSVLEAMALGRPLVALAAPGNSELVVDGFNGYLCWDLDSAVQKLTDLVQSGEKRKDFGAGSRAIINNNYTREILEENWRSLYLNFERYYRFPT